MVVHRHWCGEREGKTHLNKQLMSKKWDVCALKAKQPEIVLSPHHFHTAPLPSPRISLQTTATAVFLHGNKMEQFNSLYCSAVMFEHSHFLPSEESTAPQGQE